MMTLVLESSTYVGSVALLDGDRVLAERTVAMRGREHEALMPAVAELIQADAATRATLARVVCGAGPGSFTSLRIAGSIAKGLAMSLGVPLIPISSLALLAASAGSIGHGRYLCVIDAMRGEHYAQTFGLLPDGIRVLDELRLVPSAALDALALSEGAIVIGPDQTGAACVSPRADGAARLTKLIDNTHPADLASWEPSYGRLAEAQVKWEAEQGRPLIAR